GVAAGARRRVARQLGARRGVPEARPGGARMNGSARRVGALALRYLLLVGRDPARCFDIVYWPLVDVAVWAFLTLYVTRSGAQVPNAIAVFVGAAILWNVFLRAAQD